MSTQTFTISRVFDAPRALVWKAWTDPKLFSKWFGPKGCVTQVKTFDVRPGGILHSCLQLPNGGEMWAKFVYREVDAPSRLVWEHSFADKDGNIASHPMKTDWPSKLLTTVVFEEQNGKTKITLTWLPLDATEPQLKAFEEEIRGMTLGWGGTFDRLDELFHSQEAA